MQEDVLSCNSLPGYSQVEDLATTLTKLALEEGMKVSITKDVRNDIAKQWSQLEDHDKDAAKFVTSYKARWGQCLYGHTEGIDKGQTVMT